MSEWFQMFLTYLLGGIVLGLVLNNLLLGVLHKIARKTPWQWDDIAVQAVRGKLFWVVALTGLSLATYHLPLMAPEILAFFRTVLLAIVLMIIAHVISQFIIASVRRYLKQVQGLPSTSNLMFIVAVVVYLVGIMVVLQTIGVSVLPILTALGVGGLAVSLALQDTLSNIFAGIQLILSKQFVPGDYIKMLDTQEEGFIEDIAWRYTTVRRTDKNLVIVPNAKLATTSVMKLASPTTG